MFPFLFEIAQQVTKYSSIFGKLWYVLVFGFRLIVVTSIGGSVYGDENGGFSCDIQSHSCTGLCYDQFAPISHMRLWAFQITAVATPTVLFHFFVLHVQSQITKIEKVERLKRDMSSRTDVKKEAVMQKALRKHERRKKAVGKVELKTHVNVSNIEEVMQTRKIRIVYFLSLLIRIAVEVTFIFVSYRTMLITNTSTQEGGSSSNPLWMRVPKFYECPIRNDNAELLRACASHKDTFVSCYISRPSEKTYFVRYMNITGFICAFLTASEIVTFLIRRIEAARKKSKQYRRETALANPNSVATSAPAAWVQLDDIQYQNETRRNSGKMRRAASYHSDFSDASVNEYKKNDYEKS